MASFNAVRGIVLAAVAGVVYQVYIRQFVELLGMSREMKTLADFPFQCRRVNDLDFQACEDMWYDDATKEIYLACSTTALRKEWLPNMGSLKAPTSDKDQRVVVLDINKPAGDTYIHRQLGLKKLKSQFHSLSITGFKDSSSGKTKFYMINNKPTLDPSTGLPTDNSKTGASESIELFEHQPGSSDLVHIQTYEHPLITTPNNIAVAKDGSFFFTNDHGPYKTGIMEPLSVVLHRGTVVHCKASTPIDCAIVSTSHSFPNGVVIPDTHPNLLFVASAGFGRGIRVYDILPAATTTSSSSSSNGHPRLRLRQKIPLTMPVDNLTYDTRTKSIYAAGLAGAKDTIMNMQNATNDHRVAAPGSVLRIFEEKNLVDGARWVAETVLEDPHGTVLPDTTTALRDGNGAIWMSSIMSPFITVCEPKRIGG